MPNPQLDAACARTVARYRAVGRGVAGWIAFKLRWDPVYRQLAERGPYSGSLVDLGCGRGQAAILLAELHPELAIAGYDWDRGKLDQARRAARGLSAIDFHAADVRHLELPEADTYLLIDLLHYGAPPEQDVLLMQTASALRPGGRLFVRDLDADGGWRSLATRGQERLARLLGLHRGATLAWRPAAELVSILERAGLAVTRMPSWGRTPFSNVLIEARR